MSDAIVTMVGALERALPRASEQLAKSRTLDDRREAVIDARLVLIRYDRLVELLDGAHRKRIETKYRPAIAKLREIADAQPAFYWSPQPLIGLGTFLFVEKIDEVVTLGRDGGKDAEPMELYVAERAAKGKMSFASERVAKVLGVNGAKIELVHRKQTWTYFVIETDVRDRWEVDVKIAKERDGSLLVRDDVRAKLDALRIDYLAYAAEKRTLEPVGRPIEF